MTSRPPPPSTPTLQSSTLRHYQSIPQGINIEHTYPDNSSTDFPWSYQTTRMWREVAGEAGPLPHPALV